VDVVGDDWNDGDVRGWIRSELPCGKMGLTYTAHSNHAGVDHYSSGTGPRSGR